MLGEGREDQGGNYCPTVMNFGEAIHKLKQQQRVARDGWNKAWLVLIIGWDTLNLVHYSAKLPFIALKMTDGSISPWVPRQEDLLAEDWSVV